MPNREGRIANIARGAVWGRAVEGRDDGFAQSPAVQGFEDRLPRLGWRELFATPASLT